MVTEAGKEVGERAALRGETRRYHPLNPCVTDRYKGGAPAGPSAAVLRAHPEELPAIAGNLRYRDLESLLLELLSQSVGVVAAGEDAELNHPAVPRGALGCRSLWIGLGWRSRVR